MQDFDLVLVKGGGLKLDIAKDRDGGKISVVLGSDRVVSELSADDTRMGVAS